MKAAPAPTGTESAPAAMDGFGVPTVTQIQKKILRDADGALSKSAALRIAKRMQIRIKAVSYADPTGERAAIRVALDVQDGRRARQEK